MTSQRDNSPPVCTLITGGARSGKSRHALSLAATATRKAFIATAEPSDEEMRQRIAAHQAQRDASFFTVEEPIDLAQALGGLPGDTTVAVIDCLTVWLGNLVHRSAGDPAGYGETAGVEGFAEIASFLDLLKEPPCDLILVTNELGMGIVPAEPLARRFRDLAGWLNQEVAHLAQHVILMVSGIPIEVKR